MRTIILPCVKRFAFGLCTPLLTAIVLLPVTQSRAQLTTGDQGADYRICQHRVQITDPITGALSNKVYQYTLLQSGLNCCRLGAPI